MRPRLHLRLQVVGPVSTDAKTSNHTFATGDLRQASIHKFIATSELTRLGDLVVSKVR